MITLLFSGILLAANDAEIEALIDAIVTATPQTRHEKVNAFKAKMRELNARQRRQALEALQQKMYPQLDPAKAAQSVPQTPLTPQQSGSAQQQMKMQEGPGVREPKMRNMPQQQQKRALLPVK